MILSSRDVEPIIAECRADPERVISDDVAQTIASWWHSPARIDEHVTRLSHGLEFDARVLLSRVDELIRDTSASGDSHPDLVVLRRWVLARLPHLTVTTIAISVSSWEAWSQQWGQTDADQPEEITSDTEEHIVADSADDLGEWVYPGEDQYPSDTTGLDVEPDGGIWLPRSAVDTAAAMLTGRTTRFWAQSYGGDPFAPGPSWWESDTFAEQGPNRPYASRYIHPYTGDVEISLARVRGFSPDDHATIHHLWKTQGR